jgi:hypothetical protein
MKWINSRKTHKVLLPLGYGRRVEGVSYLVIDTFKTASLKREAVFAYIDYCDNQLNYSILI